MARSSFIQHIRNDLFWRARWTYQANKPQQLPTDVRSRPRFVVVLAASVVLSVTFFIALLASYAYTQTWGDWSQAVTFGDGRLMVWKTLHTVPPVSKPVYQLQKDWGDNSWPRLVKAGEAVDQMSPWRAPVWFLSIPLWFPMALFGALSFGFWAWRWPWGFCKRCGYNLRWVSRGKPCPECGGETTRT